MTEEAGRKAEFPAPTHAYVPGETPRHPEDAFAVLCETAQPGSDIATLTRSHAWRCGLEWLRAGYYWEAHELFEPVWMALPQNAPERRLVQSLIQLANAGLKTRMGRPKAAARLLDMAEALLRECKAGQGEARMGLRLDMVDRWIEEMRAQQ